jgi:jumonji domain-containing protein 2
VEQKSLPLSTFRELAEEPANAPPSSLEPEALERKFWKNVPLNPPLYGADVPGSLFDDRKRGVGWNLRWLDSILSSALERSGSEIPGVTQPYLYAGSWRSFFAWHTEDLDLHSVNYLHIGAPKTWYIVPPAVRDRFELLASNLLPELSRECPEFLRHKEILMSPALLAAHNISLTKVVHRAREFIVVGPGAYHAGFNHGFNVAESVNFATPAWVPIGARASFCTCRPDSVKIDMRLFLEYMDEELAEEVKDSYSSDEDEDDEEESLAEDVEDDKLVLENTTSTSTCEDDTVNMVDELREIRRHFKRRRGRPVIRKSTPVVDNIDKKKIRGERRPLNQLKQSNTKITKQVAGARRRGGNSRKQQAAVQEVVVVATSSDDETLRPSALRGAAVACYKLFDSLLPSLKRVRTEKR